MHFVASHRFPPAFPALVVVLAVLLSGALDRHANCDEPPNVLLIVADDV